MLVATSTHSSRRKTPETVYGLAMVPTAWGACGVVWKNHEYENVAGFAQQPAAALLCRIFIPGRTLAESRQGVLKAFPHCREVIGAQGRGFHPETVPEWFGELSRYLQGYFAAALREWTQPQFADNWAYWRPRLDWMRVTPFQRRVLEVVANIPSGAQMTYGQVARQAGNPAAARAVGMAMRGNPWPVLVPCHRVMGAGGKLTGFSAPGGVQTKQKMLALEAG